MPRRGRAPWPALDPQRAADLSDSGGAIVIEGHTSSEGTDAYDLDLSQRRAQAVVDELVRRAVSKATLRADPLPVTVRPRRK